MNQQELLALRTMIVAHKRWDMMFGLLGILALMIALMTFTALFADMAINGLGRISWEFLTSFPSRRAADAGILSAWVGSGGQTCSSFQIGFPSAMATLPVDSPLAVPSQLGGSVHWVAAPTGPARTKESWRRSRRSIRARNSVPLVFPSYR